MKKIIFFGSDQYSAIVLKELLDIKMTVSSVITTRPKPKGRDGVIVPNPVDIEANKREIKVLYYPENNEDMNNFIASIGLGEATTGLTASFPRLLPPSLICAFASQLYNIHPSLLPQYRNVAPVPYALAMGDEITGVSIFEIGNGIDNGQIVAQADHAILPTDTTPIMLGKLFSLGTKLLVHFLQNPNDRELTDGIRVMRSADLIFTRRLSRESAYIEWPVLLQLIEDQPLSIGVTTNPLITLRLQHHPDRNKNILVDMIRAHEGYEKVWSIAETKKGQVQIALSCDLSRNSELSVLIAGKPKPITWSQFQSIYLSQ
jgi:methionyl-tRNA formyltransferase